MLRYLEKTVLNSTAESPKNSKGLTAKIFQSKFFVCFPPTFLLFGVGLALALLTVPSLQQGTANPQSNLYFVYNKDDAKTYYGIFYFVAIAVFVVFYGLTAWSYYHAGKKFLSRFVVFKDDSEEKLEQQLMNAIPDVSFFRAKPLCPTEPVPPQPTVVEEVADN